MHVSRIIEISELEIGSTLYCRPVAIRPIEWNESEERIFFARLVLQILYRFVGKEINSVAGEIVRLIAVNDVIFVKTCGVAMRKRHPVIKRQLRLEGYAKVIFSDQCGVVTSQFDDRRQVRKFANRGPIIRPFVHQAVIQPVVNAMLTGHQARQDRSSAR